MNIGVIWSEVDMTHEVCLYLFQAIEAKNLIGRYDTSLYLKAQVDNLRGHNEELRTELKSSRLECIKSNVELEKVTSKVSSILYS